MPKQRQTCTRCSQRRQKCDRSKTGKAACSRCIQNNEGHLCSTVWAGGYDPAVHRKYPRRSSPAASWPASSETTSSHDTPPAIPAVEQLKLPALTPDIQTPSRARNQTLPSHFRSGALLAGPLSAVGPEALSAGAHRFPEITIGALISENDVSTVPLLDQESKNMRAKGTSFTEKMGTAANSTSCFSPAARAVETVQMQSLLPSTEKILLMVEYHEQFLTYWGGGLYHGPSLKREIRKASNPSGKIDLTTVDWRWTGLLFSILSSCLIGSPEGVSLEWGFSIEEKVRLSRLWGAATVTSLNLGDYTSQYHLTSMQAIMNMHGFEHLVGSSNQWAALRSVAMVIGRGLNLHRLGPHPDDDRLPYLTEHQKEAFIEREIGRRIWYAAATQEWLSSSSQTFQGYSIQRKHFTTSKPAIFDEETILPVEEGTPTFAVVGNYFFDYAYLLLQFGDDMLEAEDLDETSRYNLILKWDGELRSNYAEKIPKCLSHRTPIQPHWPKWVSWARRLHEASCSHKIIMVHQSFLNKSFKDVRYTYSRWACATAARHVLSLYPKREPDEPQFWVEQAFSITAGICLILELFHRSEINAEAQEYLACVKRAVVYLASFPTSSVANHGVRVLTSMLQEYTKRLEAARGSTDPRPTSHAATSQMPQCSQGPEDASIGEAGDLQPVLSANPEDPLSNDVTSAFNFDIDMMEFEDLLDVLPTEMGVDTNAFYDGMLSASSGAYNPGWGVGFELPRHEEPHHSRSPTLHTQPTTIASQSPAIDISGQSIRSEYQSPAVQIEKFVTDLTSVAPKDCPSPKPQSPKALHVKITHAAITHVDLLYAQGLHQNNKRHVQPPFILGTEFSGIVTSAPPGSSFEPGTRVFGGGLGSFAEDICVDEASVRRVPRQWSNAEACAVGASGAVSYGALVGVTNVKKGETVLVLGASGGLGVMAVQIAKALGAKVIAVVGDAEKADVVRRIGADAVVNYLDERWEEQVRNLTPGGQGVEVVYDGIGAVESGIKCLRYRGRLVIVGFAARGGKMESIRANRILLKSAMVHGYRFGEDSRQDPQRAHAIWDGFMKLVDSGKIQPVVYKEAYQGLEAVSQALDDAKNHKAWGRAILRINDNAEQELQQQRSKL